MGLTWLAVAIVAFVFQVLNMADVVTVIACLIISNIWLAAEWVLVTVRDWDDR